MSDLNTWLVRPLALNDAAARACPPSPAALPAFLRDAPLLAWLTAPLFAPDAAQAK